MKRAMVDVVFFLGATAVVFLAVAVFILVLQLQNIVALDRAYVVRACSFINEFFRQDSQAVEWFGLFMGLVIVTMARLTCQLPRPWWALRTAAHPLPGPRRPHPPETLNFRVCQKLDDGRLGATIR